MSMRIGLLGKKIGMTQLFAEDGERVPVTVIQTGPCYVVGKRTEDKDGYSALVIGFGEKPAVRLAQMSDSAAGKPGGLVAGSIAYGGGATVLQATDQCLKVLLAP